MPVKKCFGFSTALFENKTKQKTILRYIFIYLCIYRPKIYICASVLVAKVFRQKFAFFCQDMS